MFRSFVLLVALAGADALARITFEPEVKVHNATTSSWFVHSKPAADSIVTLTVPLKLQAARRELLEKTLLEVSDPASIKYGMHLKHNQIAKLLAVPDEQVDRVRNFFKVAGASAVEVSPTKDVLTVAISIEAAEAALSTTLNVFSHHQKKSLRIVRASKTYSLPADIAADVLMVGELLQFPQLRQVKRVAEDFSFAVTVDDPEDFPSGCASIGCNGKVTPTVLALRYNLPNSTGVPVAGNSMAVAEFQGQFYKTTDLTTFSTSCQVKVDVDTQIGTNRNTAGIEAELDIEYIKSVAPAVPLTVVYDASYSLLSWANQITTLTNPPLVHSVSYGNDESQQTSVAYMESCNTAFMKAGTMGLSILFASGDQGVCGRSGCGLFKVKRFHPDFPAASPYITAVGGTDFVKRGVIGDEMAWTDGGGGFSDTFPIPAWQEVAVGAYKGNPDADLPDASLWNNTGRGYPDIAALGGQVNPYCICANGRFEGVAGTSAACPVAAGVFARLNGIRLSAGKAPLGFLNPFIYMAGPKGGFHDVQTGKITGNTQNIGFSATDGWDAATGWGTPSFDVLSTLV